MVVAKYDIIWPYFPSQIEFFYVKNNILFVIFSERIENNIIFVRNIACGNDSTMQISQIKK